MKDQASDKRSPIIIGALILTAIFLAVFGWLLSRTSTCPEGWWLWDRLDCLEPNALGDTFAGAFAPVAFVWLVAAVLLQRNELAAQRQELREARAVAEAQVLEARNNVAHMAKQTELLSARSIKEDEAAEDERFEEAVAALVETIEHAAKDVQVWGSMDVGFGTMQDFSAFVLNKNEHEDVLRRLAAYCEDLRTSSINIFREIELSHHLEYHGLEKIDLIANEIQEVIGASSRASIHTKKRFELCSPTETVERLAGLRSHIESHGKWRDPGDF